MKNDSDIKKPIIILGAGGYAKVLIETLRLLEREIIGITDPAILNSSEYVGVNVLGDDSKVFNYVPSQVELVNAIGAMPGNNLRRMVSESMEQKGYRFTEVIHPSAVIASDVDICSGAQIMAGVVIQPGVSIGRSCIVNTGVNLDHDCVIHDDCHLAPGVTLSGNVVIGERSHIGTGSLIIQGITIGNDCIIAAGSIIHKDIPPGTKFIQLREVMKGDV
jgi:sugar O-acyltransferase (sialic acid O-acetyltransferase NeuD family)